MKQIDAIIADAIPHYLEKGHKEIRLLGYSREFSDKAEYRSVKNLTRLFFHYSDSKRDQEKIGRMIKKAYRDSDPVSKMEALKTLYYTDQNFFREELPSLADLGLINCGPQVLFTLLELMLATNLSEFRHFRLTALSKSAPLPKNSRIFKISAESLKVSAGKSVNLEIEIFEPMTVPCITVLFPPVLSLIRNNRLFTETCSILPDTETAKFSLKGARRGKAEVIIFAEDLMNSEMNNSETLFVEVE